MQSSEYVNDARRQFSIYVLQHRSIPAITDGLKASHRRVLWTARDGKKYKTATLAGATMPIHPHGEASGAINTLAAPYSNNIPLFDGDGAFGTLLNPGAFGAARYTSVKVSQFAKDVMFADIELVPMQANYDETLQEPIHFLPLIPIVLLNPSEGIAVGFASTILPRRLEDIIEDQIKHLQKKKIEDRPVYFKPTDQTGLNLSEKNNYKWLFQGKYKRINSSTLQIIQLPYGVDHSKYIEHLMKLEEENKIVDYEDNSKDIYDITIKFKRGLLNREKETTIYQLLKLNNTITENMNVLDFDGKYILGANYVQIIEDFTDWRLTWYKKRYQRLAKLLNTDIQKYKDILLAIKKNLGSVARQIQTRTELKDFCSEIGIIHTDYIADLSVYRFTENEKNKVEKKLKEAENLMENYQMLLKNPKERAKVYIRELKSILKTRPKTID